MITSTSLLQFKYNNLKYLQESCSTECHGHLLGFDPSDTLSS